MTRSPPKREQRKITFVKAFMAVGEEWVEVTVSNISAHGMMVKCDVPPPVGSPVTIRRRGAGAQGTVRWVNGRRFGMYSPEDLDLSGFVAASAAETLAMDNAVTQKPRAFERLWHWRSRS